ncbi:MULTISPECIES: hypothetical protein [unclassified Paraburkholderia]|uniref:hypothetical protein n=1 Tax=unclassified Paraburkholderia TaxID=2615204 RepID=UPI002AB050EC|nr:MULTISPECIES: hypothetical protein [unclassified Paraburkholderia]
MKENDAEKPQIKTFEVSTEFVRSVGPHGQGKPQAQGRIFTSRDTRVIPVSPTRATAASKQEVAQLG